MISPSWHRTRSHCRTLSCVRWTLSYLKTLLYLLTLSYHSTFSYRTSVFHYAFSCSIACTFYHTVSFFVQWSVSLFWRILYVRIYVVSTSKDGQGFKWWLTCTFGYTFPLLTLCTNMQLNIQIYVCRIILVHVNVFYRIFVVYLDGCFFTADDNNTLAIALGISLPVGCIVVLVVLVLIIIGIRKYRKKHKGKYKTLFVL